jgi:uncharacterized protein YerC
MAHLPRSPYGTSSKALNNFLERLVSLENKSILTTWFDTVSSPNSTGTLSPPALTNLAVQTDLFPGGADLLVSGQGADGRPDYSPVYDGSGNLVTGTLGGTDNLEFTLSAGTYSGTICLIYYYVVPLRYFNYSYSLGDYEVVYLSSSDISGTAGEIDVTDSGGSVTIGLDAAASGKLVTNGDSHDHSGGDGAQIDHGGLTGLSDDDHPQYPYIISSDTTYYFSSSGNDSTGDGSSGNPWKTPSPAIHLARKRIASDATVTFQLADGHYSFTDDIDLSHPSGGRVKIQGENTYSISMTGVNSVGSEQTGTGDWRYKDVEVDLSDVSNIAADDVLIFYDASGGTNPGSMNGTYVVQSVDSGNSRATIRQYYDDTYTNQPSGAVTATVKVVKAVLSFTGAYGVVLQNQSAIQEIKDFAIIGDFSNTVGLYIYKQSSIAFGAHLGIAHFDSHGFFASEISTCYVRFLVVSACRYGIGALFSYVDATFSVATHCRTRGVDSQQAAYVKVYGSDIHNNDTGAYASWDAFIDARSVSTSNNGTDFSPAVNTTGNDNSYINN